jgi:hypothetical protein
LWTVPPGFPPEFVGEPMVVLGSVYSGSVEDGERITQPLRELATPLLDLSGPEPYTAVQASFDPFFPKGLLYYWKGLNVNGLPDELIAEICQKAAERPSSMTDIPIWHQGGAMSRVGESETAYGNRKAPFMVTFEATWTDPAESEQNIQWSRDGWDRLHKYSDGSIYLNFPGFGEEKEDMVRAAYGPNYDRLKRLKTQYDPTNLFRMNQNITP